MAVKEENWETWNVGLWLNNDEGMYLDCKALARASTDPDDLESYVERLIRLEDTKGLARDLLQNSLHKVDWDSLMKDFRE